MTEIEYIQTQFAAVFPQGEVFNVDYDDEIEMIHVAACAQGEVIAAWSMEIGSDDDQYVFEPQPGFDCNKIAFDLPEE